MSLEFLLSMGGQSFVDTSYYNDKCEYILSQMHERFQKVKYLRHVCRCLCFDSVSFPPSCPTDVNLLGLWFVYRSKLNMSMPRGVFHSFPEGLHIVFPAFSLSDFTIHGLHFAAWKCNKLAPYIATGVVLMAFYISASLRFLGVGVGEWVDLALPEMERGSCHGNHTEKIRDCDRSHQAPVNKHQKMLSVPTPTCIQQQQHITITHIPI